MKKFWVILLSLGLLMAFAMPAAAVDVKFSGHYYAQGWYVDNPSVLDKTEVSTSPSWANNSRRSASAWYSQQFRLTTEFQVVEGLKLVTRIDALEKKWGDQSWAGSTGETQSRVMGQNGTAATGTKIQENIEFERAYLDFNVPFGKFQVGYMQFLMWGTDFLNTPLSAGGIRYFFSQGPIQVVAAIEKRAEYLGLSGGKSGAAVAGSGYIGQGSDADKDVYDLGIVYKMKPGEAGLLYQYVNSSQAKTGYINGYKSQMSGIFPYAKLTFGNFFIEGEGVYGFGNLRSYETNGASTNSGASSAANGSLGQDVGVSALGLFLHGKYDLKPAYVGLQFVYLSGDDAQNSDKSTGNLAQLLQANYGFNRALILWNADYGDNMGGMGGNIGSAANARTGVTSQVIQFMDNVWFYQAYVGVRPMPKLDVKLAFSIASADKKPKNDVGAVGSAGYYTNATVKEFVSSDYGKELDLTASYKIYDNLTYMIGAGYLWTGDYFKGYDANVTVSNNYLLSHRLTLNF
ncbi:MAG: hypothetical protein M0P16_01835 [Syntrophales bacterium]|jgi:hypothetical protein|nr:hypothetical protein [Syntrophales bacterium]MCK9391905.1 hypothetical protein [Syntrophales bacterium]